MVISSWGRSKSSGTRRAPKGWRAYAIGDVHGRLDLLESLLEQISLDHRERGGSAKPLLVFLGDLIDRGPASAAVVEKVRRGPLPEFRTIVLAGNHEEVLLRLLDDGETGLLSQWLQFGGKECLASYGGEPALIELLSEEEGLRQVRSLIPAEHASFLRELGDTFTFGDYLFVHAGLRPGIPLASQSPRDLRWIRGEFLHDPRDHGPLVVHGHTISRHIDEHPNRIGIDTGAYRYGVLTAIGLEGTDRWYLQQHEPADAQFSSELLA